MKSKRSNMNMNSLWNTHGYRTYLFGIELVEPPELQAIRVGADSKRWRSASSGLWPKWSSLLNRDQNLNQHQYFTFVFGASNSEHFLVMVGVTVYLRDTLGDAGSVWGRAYLQKRTSAFQHTTTSSLLFGPDGGARMERWVAQK